MDGDCTPLHDTCNNEPSLKTAVHDLAMNTIFRDGCDFEDSLGDSTVLFSGLDAATGK
jgi:hypothetical protein